jgi:hypothetical protein
MKKLQDFKGALFTKEAMQKTVGGKLMAVTKTNCNGSTTCVNGSTVQDCGDTEGFD